MYVALAVCNVLCCVIIFKLVEKENVKAVLSYNEGYELNFFTNSKEVGQFLSNSQFLSNKEGHI